MNTIDQFREAMASAGIAPPSEIIADGRLHRFKIGRKLSGAYCLHTDGRPAGFFQDFRLGVKGTWRQDGDFKRLSDSERQAFAIARQRQAEKRQGELLERHDKAARRAMAIWRGAKPAPEDHPYLVRKLIKPHGARVGVWRRTIGDQTVLVDDALILPICDRRGALRSLQAIFPEKHPILDRDKDFLPCGELSGLFWWLGPMTQVILICEGFATAASLHADSGYRVFMAFSAGNLREVSAQVRKYLPAAEIIVCGDNDLSGVGQKAAQKAALAVGGQYVIPPVAGLDFNDYLNSGFLEQLKSPQRATEGFNLTRD